MNQHQQHASASALALLALASLAALAGIVAISHEANAASSSTASSFVWLQLGSAGGNRLFLLTGPDGQHYQTQVAPEGGSIPLLCTETPSGTLPPGAPDSNGITIRAFVDNQAFPAPVGTAGFWSASFTSCVTPQSLTFYCTSDGTATGSPRSGLVRLYLSAVRTAQPGTYSDDSDQASSGTDTGGYGLVMCQANETSLTLAPAGLTFEGGETITATITSASSSYSAGNLGTLRVKCGSPWTGSGANGPLGPGASSTLAATIAPASWPAGCSSFRLNASITATSQLTGFSWPMTSWAASSTDAASNATTIGGGLGTVNVNRDIEISVPGVVTYAASFDGVNMTKCASGVPACASVSSFIISGDSLYLQAWGLRDPQGNAQTGVPVTCTQTDPNGNVVQTTSMGATNAHGASPIQVFGVQPPHGAWTFTCTASFNGNTASYTETATFASAYTGNLVASVKWSVTTEPTNGTLHANISVLYQQYDASLDDTAPLVPDAAPKCTLVTRGASGAYDAPLLDRAIMARVGGNGAAWSCEAWAQPASLQDAYAVVLANVSGSPYLAEGGYSGNLSLPGTLHAVSLEGAYDISGAVGMIQTSADAFVQPAVFALGTMGAVGAGVWAGTSDSMAVRVAIVSLLAVLAIWMATQSTSGTTTALQWVCVLVTSGFALIAGAKTARAKAPRGDAP